MAKSIWGDLPPVLIKPSALKKAVVQPPSTLRALQVLNEIGENAIALNSAAMEKSNMKHLFKGFNPEEITPKQLKQAGMILFRSGFIDNLTADLMSRTGDEFDKDGKVVDMDKPINALEFLAGRIVEMEDKASWGDRYAKILLPDYIRTIHVIQNLQAFASSGDSHEMLKIREEEKRGDRPVTPKARG